MPPKPRTTSKSGTSRAADAQAVRELLVWFRMQRFHVASIRVGDVEVNGLADLATIAAVPSVAATADDPTDYRKQYGGAGLARLAKDAGRDGESAIVEDDE